VGASVRAGVTADSCVGNNVGVINKLDNISNKLVGARDNFADRTLKLYNELQTAFGEIVEEVQKCQQEIEAAANALSNQAKKSNLSSSQSSRNIEDEKQIADSSIKENNIENSNKDADVKINEMSGEKYDRQKLVERTERETALSALIKTGIDRLVMNNDESFYFVGRDGKRYSSDDFKSGNEDMKSEFLAIEKACSETLANVKENSNNFDYIEVTGKPAVVPVVTDENGFQTTDYTKKHEPAKLIAKAFKGGMVVADFDASAVCENLRKCVPIFVCLTHRY